MLYEAIKKLIDRNGLTEELKRKIDVLFIADRLTEDEYLASVNKVGYHVERIDERTFALVTDEEVSEVSENDGTDYLRPITYSEGMTVEAGLWYTDGNDIWEAIASGTPESFADANYFDIITI